MTPFGNPYSSRLLIWATRNRQRLPMLHRITCIILGSDLYCEVPLRLVLPHPYGIIVHSQAMIGESSIIMQQVTIGGKNVGDNGGVPRLGSNCYVGAGAKILGPVTVGDDVTVGANAVVTRDVPSGATVVGFNRIVLSKH